MRSRSAAGRCFELRGVARAPDRDRGRGAFDLGEVVPSQLDIHRAEVLLEPVELCGTGDRHDPRLLPEEPPDRDLRGSRVFLFRDSAEQIDPASVLVLLLPNGIAEVKVAASDMGPGTYTSMTQVAADFLGLDFEQIRFSLGRSDFPPAPPHGGSQTMASVGSAVRAACIAVLERAAKRAVRDQRSLVFGAPLDGVEWNHGRIRRLGDTSPGQPFSEIVKSAGQSIEAEASTHRDPGVAARYSMIAFGATFAEVAVDPDVATVTVRRAFGAYGVGRVINPSLATSQCIGGMVGGIGMALMERTVLDWRDGCPVNAHMADYLVPVNLDIQQIEAQMVEEDDPHVNP